MFDRWKSTALHCLVGLTALAVVPLSCILVLELTDRERVVRHCSAAVCAASEPAQPRVRLIYQPVRR